MSRSRGSAAQAPQQWHHSQRFLKTKSNWSWTMSWKPLTYVDTPIVNVHFLLKAHIEACIWTCWHRQLFVHLGLRFLRARLSKPNYTSTLRCQKATSFVWLILNNKCSDLALKLPQFLTFFLHCPHPRLIGNVLRGGRWLRLCLEMVVFDGDVNLYSFELWVVANVCILIITLQYAEYNAGNST